MQDLTNIINNDKIFGEMKKGFKEGKGILYYNIDDKYKRKRYEGNFKDDKMDGKGIYYQNDGDRYEGEWKNGVFDGKGTYPIIMINLI